MIFEEIFDKEIEEFSHEIENIDFNWYWEKQSSYVIWNIFKWFLHLKWAYYDEKEALSKYNFLLKTSFDKAKIWDNIILKSNKEKFKVKLINKKKFDSESQIYELHLEKIESL